MPRKIGTYRHIPGDGSPEPEDLPGQEPPHEADAVRRLVVARDGDVDKLKHFIIEVLAFSQKLIEEGALQAATCEDQTQCTGSGFAKGKNCEKSLLFLPLRDFDFLSFILLRCTGTSVRLNYAR
jgi:hypothetical protein